MIAEAPKNKIIEPSADNAGAVTLKAVSGIKNEYHFPGAPDWKPLSVIASTYEEALALWKQLRKPVTPDAAKPAAAKVEAAKETTNDNQ